MTPEKSVITYEEISLSPAGQVLGAEARVVTINGVTGNAGKVTAYDEATETFETDENIVLVPA